MSTGPGFRDQESYRTAFRIGGGICAGVGLILVVIGFASFARDFNNPGLGSSSSPSIWPMFVGIPLLGLGGFLLKAGFFGAGVRYLAGEVSPTARSTMGYLGLGGHHPTCPACGATSTDDAAFCASCGAPLNRVCGACQRVNDASSRFCAGCGAALS